MARGKKAAPVEVAPEQPVFVSKSGYVSIPGVKREEVKTLIVGTTMLVTHKFSEKMRAQMESKQQGEAKGAREPKKPKELFEAARYRLADGGDGIPAGGLKSCIVAGARGEETATMAGSKGAIFVESDCKVTDLVRIYTGTDASGNPIPPISRTDVVRNATGVADIRYRPQYTNWAIALRVQFLPSLLSRSQVLQMIAHAGIADGLCEWRPGSKKSLSGQWGTFRLAEPEEIEAFEDGTLFSEPRAVARRKIAKAA